MVVAICHPERSEGSSDGLYIFAGFFVSLRMTAVGICHCERLAKQSRLPRYL